MMRAMQLDLKPTGSSAAKLVTTEGFRPTYRSNPRTQGLRNHQRSLCPIPIHTSILARFLKLSFGTEPPSHTHDANPPARGVVARKRQFLNYSALRPLPDIIHLVSNTISRIASRPTTQHPPSEVGYMVSRHESIRAHLRSSSGSLGSVW